MQKEHAVEPEQPAAGLSERSRRTVAGIEVVEYDSTGDDSGESPVDLNTRPSVGSPPTAGAETTPDAAAAQFNRLEEECSRLDQALAQRTQDAERREREYERRIATLLERIQQFEHELWQKDAKLASLVRGGTNDSGVPGSEEPHTDIDSLREEVQALRGERAWLTEALDERGRQVAQLSAQLARSEISQGFGMDFRSGVGELLQREPLIAGGSPGGATAHLPAIEEQTMLLPVPAESGPEGSPGVGGNAGGEGPSATARSGTRRLRLRRYLLPLDSTAETAFELSGPRSYVGRGMVADVCLDHPTISRLHGVLYWIGGATIVEDARSTNGIFVNRQRVKQSVLKDGDVVTFGNVTFQFRVVASDV